jgi:hypothetical protein
MNYDQKFVTFSRLARPVYKAYKFSKVFLFSYWQPDPKQLIE